VTGHVDPRRPGPARRRAAARADGPPGAPARTARRGRGRPATRRARESRPCGRSPGPGRGLLSAGGLAAWLRTGLLDAGRVGQPAAGHRRLDETIPAHLRRLVITRTGTAGFPGWSSPGRVPAAPVRTSAVVTGWMVRDLHLLVVAARGEAGGSLIRGSPGRVGAASTSHVGLVLPDGRACEHAGRYTRGTVAGYALELRQLKPGGYGWMAAGHPPLMTAGNSVRVLVAWVRGRVKVCGVTGAKCRSGQMTEPGCLTRRPDDMNVGNRPARVPPVVPPGTGGG